MICTIVLLPNLSQRVALHAKESRNLEMNNHFRICLGSVEKDKLSVDLLLQAIAIRNPWLSNHGVTSAFARIGFINQRFYPQTLQWANSIAGMPKYYASNYEATGVATVCSRVLKALAALVREVNSLAVKPTFTRKALVESKTCNLVYLVLRRTMDQQNLVDLFIQMCPLAHVWWQIASHSRNSLTAFKFFTNLLFPKAVVLPNSDIANLLQTRYADVPHTATNCVVIRGTCLNKRLLDVGESCITIIQFDADFCLQLAA